MGQQSYVIPYETDEQLEIILDIIKKHNACTFHDEFVRLHPHTEFERLQSGEELDQFETYELKDGQAYKNPVYGPAQPNVLLAGNGGGRSHTFDFLNWHLDRAFPNLEIGGFSAMKPYAWDEGIKKKLKKTTLREIPSSRVEAPYAYETEISLRPARMTTRIQGVNPVYKAAVEEHAPGLSGKARMKRLRECGVTESMCLTTYETTEDGFVVYDRHYKSDNRATAEEYAAELKERNATQIRMATNMKASNLVRYKAHRAAGKKYYQVDIAVVPGGCAVFVPHQGRQFWRTEAELEAEGRSFVEAKLQDSGEWTSIDAIDAKLAAGEDVDLSGV